VAGDLEITKTDDELIVAIPRDASQAFSNLLLSMVKLLQLEKNRAKFGIAVFQDKEAATLALGEQIMHAINEPVQEHRVESLEIRLKLGEVVEQEDPEAAHLRI